MSKIDLKPCPFCGGEATIFAAEEGGVFVICRKCRARTKTKIDTLEFSTPTNAVQKVVELWNRRAGDGT